MQIFDSRSSNGTDYAADSGRNWFESVELAINKRDAAYKVWHDRVRETGYGSYMFRNADMLTASLRESMVVLCQLIWTLVFLNGSFTRTCVVWGLSMPLRDFKLRWMLSV
jgi:hypothetical protein